MSLHEVHISVPTSAYWRSWIYDQKTEEQSLSCGHFTMVNMLCDPACLPAGLLQSDLMIATSLTLKQMF